MQEPYAMEYREDLAYEPLTASGGADLRPWEDMLSYLRDYARERPEVVALTCFGVGFLLGWKLKPW
jgi:hypothetical protein